jgi:plastocyanin
MMFQINSFLVEAIMKKTNYMVLFLVGGVLLLTACSAKVPDPVKYTIEMSEYSFTPSEIQAEVGQEVTIELVNIGALEHELMIGRDVKMHDSLPDGFEHDMFESAQVEPMVMGGVEDGMDMGMSSGGMEDEHTGFMVVVPMGGENATISFTATEDMVGEWEMGCFSQDGVHYNAGMKGKLVVEP